MQGQDLPGRRRLTLDQRLMYFVTATHYLTGIAPGLLMFVPALEIFFDLRPVTMNVEWWQWALFYSGFYVLQIAIAFFTLGSFRWEVLMLASVSFPIYTRALWNAITRKEQRWHVTGQAGKASSPFNFIIPQVLFFAFLALTTAVGAWKDWGNGSLSLALAWNATNTVILGAFCITALKESHDLSAAARRTPSADPTIEPRARRLQPAAAPSSTGGAA